MTIIRIQPLRAPSADGAPAGDAPVPRQPVKTGLLPESDAQLADLGVHAAQVWQAHPWLTLRFTTQGAFAAEAAAYQQAVQDRARARAEHPSAALQLQNLDAEINEHLYRVKAMLVDKYGKQSAPAHFARLGISKQNGTFTLPRARSRRAAALLQLVEGLTAEGFVTQTLAGVPMVFAYGTAFWEPIATAYNALLSELLGQTDTIAKDVSGKDDLREQVETTLRGLAKVLAGNYPDRQEYKAQLRAFGFRRASY